MQLAIICYGRADRNFGGIDRGDAFRDHLGGIDQEPGRNALFQSVALQIPRAFGDAIDVLARRGYLTLTLRGTSATPARTVLGQRALNRPTILVTNQHSLSDAEDFSEGYRTLRLGQVVGEPTAGCDVPRPQ